MSDTRTPRVPVNLGNELVDILYKNTTLNFDMCAMNIVEILQHLATNLPQINEISDLLIQSIQFNLKNPSVNPDLNILESNLEELSSFSSQLQCGELNFYECDRAIEASTEKCIKLMTKQTRANVFSQILKNNRDRILHLFEVWQLATSKKIKNNIIELLNNFAQTDPVILRVLVENTNLTSELCFSIKQDIELMDQLSLSKSCKCLVLLVVNNPRMQLSFIDFLKQDDFLEILFNAVESEKDYLFMNLNEDASNDDPGSKQTIIEVFVHLLLAINKKFLMPEENLIVNFINMNQDTIANRKFLSEAIINLFNFENDPLLNYSIQIDDSNSLASNLNLQNEDGYYVNSTLKFVSDLFSSSITKFTTSIFYSNDFNVLIDIILRKLGSLGPDDQIRVDYLSLVQLIIQNSDYMESGYRKNGLIECFNGILAEKDQATIDQDIIRIILNENPSLRS